MSTENVASSNGNRVVWIAILVILVVLLGLNLEFFRDVFKLLTYRPFLSGFGNMLLIAVCVSIVGGGLGVALGRLAQINEWSTRAAIRFLRLGMWVPFFIFWVLFSYPPRDAHQPKELVEWLTMATIAVIVLGPTVLLSSCYYYLSFRVLAKLETFRVGLQLARATLLQALLMCLLGELFLPGIWPWSWFITWPVGASTSAAVILMVIVVLASNLIFRWTLDKAMDWRPAMLFRELRNNDIKSLIGALLIAGAFLFVWQVYNESLKTVFGVDPPLEVGRVVYRLLIEGTPAVNKTRATIWSDMGWSLAEITGGLALSVVFAFLVSRVPSGGRFYTITRELLPLTYAAPVALTAQLAWWAGVGISLKILIIACFTFFPAAQAFWSYRDIPQACRLLVAIDEALPYAFVGMIFGEAFAATAGLGFFMLMAHAYLKTADALAASFITAVILVGVSSVLRWILKNSLCQHPEFLKCNEFLLETIFSENRDPANYLLVNQWIGR